MDEYENGKVFDWTASHSRLHPSYHYLEIIQSPHPIWCYIRKATRPINIVAKSQLPRHLKMHYLRVMSTTWDQHILPYSIIAWSQSTTESVLDRGVAQQDNIPITAWMWTKDIFNKTTHSSNYNVNRRSECKRRPLVLYEPRHDHNDKKIKPKSTVKTSNCLVLSSFRLVIMGMLGDCTCAAIEERDEQLPSATENVPRDVGMANI